MFTIHWSEEKAVVNSLFQLKVLAFDLKRYGLVGLGVCGELAVGKTH